MSDLSDIAGPGLKFMHVNTQSIFPKLGEMQLLMNQAVPDVLCVTESWLSPSIPDGMITLDNYVAYRYDWLANKGGGGLVRYFSDSIVTGVNPDKYVACWRSNSDIEVQVFE